MNNLYFQYLAIEYADAQNVPHVASYDDLLTHPSVVIASTPQQSDGVTVFGNEVTLPIADIAAIVTPNAVALWYGSQTQREGLTVYHIDSIDRAMEGNAYAHASVWGVLTWMVTEGGSLGSFLWDRVTPKSQAIDRSDVSWLTSYATGETKIEFEYPTSNALDLAVLVTLNTTLGGSEGSDPGVPLELKATPTLNAAPTNPVSFLLAVDSNTTADQTTRQILYGKNAMEALWDLEKAIEDFVKIKEEGAIAETPTYIVSPTFDSVTRIQLVPRFMVDAMDRLPGSVIPHQRYQSGTTARTAVPVGSMRHVSIVELNEDNLPKANAVHRATRYQGVTFSIRHYGEEICSWTPIDRITANVTVGGSFVGGLNPYIAIETPNQPTLYAPITLPEQPMLSQVTTSWWKVNGEHIEAANNSANTSALVHLADSVALTMGLTATSGGAVAAIAPLIALAGGVADVTTGYARQQRTTRALKNKTCAQDGTIGGSNTVTLFNDPTREWIEVAMTTYTAPAYDELDAYYALYGATMQSRDNPLSRSSATPFYHRGYASVRFLTTVVGFPFICSPAVVSSAIANEYLNGVVHWSGRIGML